MVRVISFDCLIVFCYCMLCCFDGLVCLVCSLFFGLLFVGLCCGRVCFCLLICCDLLELVFLAWFVVLRGCFWLTCRFFCLCWIVLFIFCTLAVV